MREAEASRRSHSNIRPRAHAASLSQGNEGGGEPRGAKAGEKPIRRIAAPEGEGAAGCEPGKGEREASGRVQARVLTSRGPLGPVVDIEKDDVEARSGRG